MQVAVSRMIASVGSMIFGSSRSSTRTSPGACMTTPRMRGSPLVVGPRRERGGVRRPSQPARASGGSPGKRCTDRAPHRRDPDRYRRGGGQPRRNASSSSRGAPRSPPSRRGGPAGTRRVPGLRRSEVAARRRASASSTTPSSSAGDLAGASAGVLDAIARALHLDDAERAHLFDLARAPTASPPSAAHGGAPAAEAPRPQPAVDARRGHRRGRVRAQRPHQDLLATNSLARAFYSPVVGDGRRTSEPRPVPVPRPRLPRLLPGLGPVRRHVRRHPARRGRPRPPRPRPARPRRRAVDPQRDVPHALGRARRPHPRHRDRALQSSRSASSPSPTRSSRSRPSPASPSSSTPPSRAPRPRTGCACSRPGRHLPEPLPTVERPRLRPPAALTRDGCNVRIWLPAA